MKPLDLQLPVVANEYAYVAPVVTVEPEVRTKVFKEKTVVSITDGDTIGISDSFKKRKFGNKQRNARQRTDDDD